jgi:hypothetical protein
MPKRRKADAALVPKRQKCDSKRGILGLLDTFRLLAPFLYLDDWMSLMLASSKHLSLRQYIKKIATRVIQTRINEIVHQVMGPRFDEFYTLLKQHDGYITGSILLQLLMGSFKANDIDIFIQDPTDCCATCNKPHITPLHRFLFEISTGEPSIPGKQWRGNSELVRCTRKVDMSETNSHLQKITYTGGIQFIKERRIWQITNVYTYVIQNVNVQVINVASNICGKKFVMSDFIPQHFDFSICTSHFDGDRVVLHNLHNIYNRQIVVNPEFVRRTMFFNDYVEQHHKGRVKKYQDRGFTLDKKLPYGKYFKVLCDQWFKVDNDNVRHVESKEDLTWEDCETYFKNGKRLRDTL